MSAITEVLKNKNKRNKERLKAQKDSIKRNLDESSYRASLHHYLNTLTYILEDSNVGSVIISIPEKYINSFIQYVYDDGALNQFHIEQMDNLTFRVRLATISL